MKRQSCHAFVRWLLPIVLPVLFTACTKKETHIPTTPIQPSLASADDFVDGNLFATRMVTSATLLQTAIVSSKTASHTQTTGYDFNGMQFGKPDDLFCGVNIGSSEDADNYYVHLQYDGPDCSGEYYLKGTVVLAVWKGIDWNFDTPGATAYFDIYPNGIRVTRLSDKKSMYITGDLLMYYPNQNQNTQIASVAALLQKKDTTLYITQSFQNNGNSIVLHYDDSTTTSMQFWWTRTYTYRHGGLMITQTPFGYSPGASRALSGTDRYQHYYEWFSQEPMLMYQACGYKISTGLLTGSFDASEPYDSASIRFGVDKDGNPPAQAVRTGTACQASYYLRYSTFRRQQPTSDLLFPE
jgi:hypothetical protein